jgi:Cu/Ag efflux protein CusF
MEAYIWRFINMKKVIASVFALALALALAAAYAAEMKGKIAKIAADQSWFSLTDGTEFSIGENVSLKGMKPGSKVKITYDQQDGKNVATKVAKAGMKITMVPDYSDL